MAKYATGDGLLRLMSHVKSRISEVESVARGALVFDWGYAVSGGSIACEAHVYRGGEEVTPEFASSCFAWSYRIGTEGTPAYVSLGTGASKSVAVSALGLGGYIRCDFTPPES